MLARLQLPGIEQHNAWAKSRKIMLDFEIVHLGQNKGRLKDATAAGVKSVPALVLDGTPFHINFGASIEALR